MVRIKWLKSAKLDLKEIYEFIALDSKRYARFQVEKIQKKTEILKEVNVVGKKSLKLIMKTYENLLKVITE